MAWVYDSPVHIRDIGAMRRPCNWIYFFDRGEVLEYRKRGIDAKHMPLAVDADMFEKVISSPSAKKQEADISFVGKLY